MRRPRQPLDRVQTLAVGDHRQQGRSRYGPPRTNRRSPANGHFLSRCPQWTEIRTYACSDPHVKKERSCPETTGPEADVGIWLPALIGTPLALLGWWAFDDDRDVLGGALFIPGSLLVLLQICILVL